MTELLDLALDAAATYRLTRLATADDILAETRGAIVRWAYNQPPRTRTLQARIAKVTGRKPRTFQQVESNMADAGFDWSRLPDWSLYAEHDPDAPKLATLVTCRWCAGMWIAAGVLILRRLCPRWWAPLARVLTAAAAAALLAGLED